MKCNLLIAFVLQMIAFDVIMASKKLPAKNSKKKPGAKPAKRAKSKAKKT